MKFFGEVDHGLETSRLDCGDNLVTLPLFPPIYHPIMYFEWHSNSLAVFARWQHCNARGIKQIQVAAQHG